MFTVAIDENGTHVTTDAFLVYMIKGGVNVGLVIPIAQQ